MNNLDSMFLPYVSFDRLEALLHVTTHARIHSNQEYVPDASLILCSEVDISPLSYNDLAGISCWPGVMCQLPYQGIGHMYEPCSAILNPFEGSHSFIADSQYLSVPISSFAISDKKNTGDVKH